MLSIDLAHSGLPVTSPCPCTSPALQFRESLPLSLSLCVSLLYPLSPLSCWPCNPNPSRKRPNPGQEAPMPRAFLFPLIFHAGMLLSFPPLSFLFSRSLILLFLDVFCPEPWSHVMPSPQENSSWPKMCMFSLGSAPLNPCPSWLAPAPPPALRPSLRPQLSLDRWEGSGHSLFKTTFNRRFLFLDIKAGA